ncbi:MAG TPA: ankyrin repeat domain-containing protein [Kofleriaceae bacterium]|nr:ankyrin repeat domain-containing protein [Kofleriaceae bacterium]
MAKFHPARSTNRSTTSASWSTPSTEPRYALRARRECIRSAVRAAPVSISSARRSHRPLLARSADIGRSEGGLVSKLDLEQQRKRAKDLLRAQRRGDAAAAERIARQLHRTPEPSTAFRLADAQLVIAREAGFASWPRLVHHAQRVGLEAPPALHEAVRAGDLEAVRAALQPAPPWQTREAIELAIERGARPIVRELLAHRGWVDVAGRSFGRWGGGLHAALLLGGDIGMIDELLAGGASIAARDRDGRTPLAIAVRTNHVAAAGALRAAGARDADEVDALDLALGRCIAGEQPSQPSHALRRSDHQHVAWAIRRGHASALAALLALGLDPNVADDDGEPPLHFAVAARDAIAIARLLEAGANVNALDFRGDTALDRALDRARDPAIVARLVAAGAVPRERGDLAELFEAAADAIADGRIDALREVLDRAPELVHARSLREHRATLLHYCGANGVEQERQKSLPNAPAIASLLLARGADPNALALTYGGGPAQTALYLAATSSFPDEAGVMEPLIAALVAGGARVRFDDRAALHAARPSALPALVRAGATIDLWLATALGRLDDVRRLLAGARPDELDAALREASASDVAAMLVDAGARVDAADIEGFTALHRAVWNDRLDVAALLISRGASVQARNAYGGDVLGTLRYAIAHAPGKRPNARQLIDMLVAAGAED